VATFPATTSARTHLAETAEKRPPRSIQDSFSPLHPTAGPEAGRSGSAGKSRGGCTE